MGLQGMTEVADCGDAREPGAALECVEVALEGVQDPWVPGSELPRVDLGVDTLKQLPGILQKQVLEVRIRWLRLEVLPRIERPGDGRRRTRLLLSRSILGGGLLALDRHGDGRGRRLGPGVAQGRR